MPSPPFDLNHQLIRAGAGTGKTTALSEHLVDVIERFLKQTTEEGGASSTHIKPSGTPKIIVTTFTKKATEELKERVVELSHKKDNPELIHFVSSSSDLHISTIHGVFNLFLKRYAHLAQMDPNFDLITKEKATQLCKKAFKKLLNKNEGLELLENYTAEEVILILRKLYDVHLIHPESNFATSSEILEMSLVQIKEAGSLLHKAGEEVLAEADLKSWQDYGNLLLHISKKIEELSPSNLNLDEILDIKKSFGNKPQNRSASPQVSEELNSRCMALMKDLIALCTDPSFSPEFLNEAENYSKEFYKLSLKFNEELLSLKHKISSYEMKDLELLSLRLLNEYPELGQAFSSDWSYWLIDEYQDTSPLQTEILKSLVGARPCFVVGDPQQSIYLFRGARSEVFDLKQKEFEKKKAEIKTLDTNYRSKPELVRFFNQVIERLGPDFLRLKPREEDDKNIPMPVHYCEAEDESEEPYLPIADYIIEGVSHGTKIEDYCVLARTNKQLITIARYLESCGVSTHVHGTGGFSLSREVQDAVSFLKFLVNPYDNENLMILLRSPWFRISDQILADLFSDRPVLFWEALKSKLPDNSVVKKLKKYLALPHERGVTRVMQEFYLEEGVMNYTQAYDTSGRRESNLWKFLVRLREAERAPGFNLISFINSLKSGEGLSEEDSEAVASLEPNKVNLMTIHKSKGLKFSHVIIPDMEVGFGNYTSKSSEPVYFDEERKRWTLSVPSLEEDKKVHNLYGKWIKESFKQREKEEFLRLFYVAITRASNSLFFMWRSSIQKDSWHEYLPDLNINKTFSKSKNEFKIAKPSEPRPPCVFKSQEYKKRKISVSQLLDEQEGQVQKTLTPKDIKRHLEAPALGVRLHHIFEKLRFDPSYDYKSYLKDWVGKDIDQFQKAVDFVMSLSEPPMPNLLKKGHVEWGYQVLTEKGIIEGQIDLWGTHEGVTWVVDYKSGNPSNKDRALRQLKLYAEALRRTGVTGPMKLVCLYPLAEKAFVFNF